MNEQRDENQVSILRIHRKPAFQGSAARLRLLLDDQKIDDIGNGDSRVYHIPSGPHSIKVVLWTGKASESMNFQSSNGEIINLTCGIGDKGLFLIPTPPEPPKAQTQASGAQIMIVVCAVIGGALFMGFDIPSRESAFGHLFQGFIFYLQGFLGGSLGALIGYAMTATRRK